MISLSNDWDIDYPREIIDLALDMVNFRISQEKPKKKMSNFLKLFFQAPDIEEVRLNSIFKKHLNCIPTSFQNKDPPTVLFQRSANIGSTVFNYKDTVNNVITDDWKSDNSKTCDCSRSAFKDPHHGHVVTGNLKVIENIQLRKLLCLGPGYREKQKIHWLSFFNNVKTALREYIVDWAKREHVDVRLLMDWETKVLEDISRTIQRLKKRSKKTKKTILKSPTIFKQLKELQEKFVFVQTDKASNNIAVICKKFYIERSMKELNIFDSGKSDGNQTYVQAKQDVKSIIARHKRYMISNSIEPADNLPFLYMIPKMHKKPYSKQRFIAASANCSTKPLSQILTKCLKLVERQHRIIGNRYFTNFGINPMWIIDNSTDVHRMFAALNRKKQCNNIRTYDFSTLYTSIPHKQLKTQLALVIKQAFEDSKKSFISVYKNDARWTDNPKKTTFSLDCKGMIRLLNWLIDNIYVTFGDKVFRQKIGIPMGTDCAPFLANLFLYSYEYKWIDKQRQLKNYSYINAFKNCCRYIDDLLLATTMI